jgi:hypothetical protein
VAGMKSYVNGAFFAIIDLRRSSLDQMNMVCEMFRIHYTLALDQKSQLLPLAALMKMALQSSFVSLCYQFHRLMATNSILKYGRHIFYVGHLPRSIVLIGGRCFI